MLNFFCRTLKDDKGFTLIEVLVVVAIIGILVALAAPRVIERIEDARVAADEATAKILNDAILSIELEAHKKNEENWDTGMIKWGELKEFLDDTAVVTKSPESDDTTIGTGIVLVGKSRTHTIQATAPNTGENNSQVWKFVVVPKDPDDGGTGSDPNGGGTSD